MKSDVFIYYCKCLFQIYGIPVRIYKNDTLILKYELVSLHPYLEPLLDAHLYKENMKSAERYTIFRSPNLCTYGFVRNKAGNLSVLIGPSLSTNIDKTSFYENMAYMSSMALPERIYKTLEIYFNAIPIMQTGRFIYILLSIYAAIYGEVIPPEKMNVIKPDVQFDREAHKGIVKHFEDISYGDIEKSNYYDYEKRLLLLIRNGMTEQLMQIWQESTIQTESASSEAGTLRSIKNRCILAIGIVSNTVLEAGVPQQDVYQLRNTYISQTEQCHSVKEALNLRYNIMVDFCRQVEHLKFKTSNVPIVNYAIKYINDNIEKKISLQEIADYVHASRSYLCGEFKKAMGTGIFRYIQEQKIERAKQMLLLTEKPLVEISTLLSFSSQSYFQKIFKEIEGITPKEFRNRN